MSNDVSIEQTENGIRVGNYVSVRGVGRPVGVVCALRETAIMTEVNGDLEPCEQALVEMQGLNGNHGRVWFIASQLKKCEPPPAEFVGVIVPSSLDRIEEALRESCGAGELPSLLAALERCRRIDDALVAVRQNVELPDPIHEMVRQALEET